MFTSVRPCGSISYLVGVQNATIGDRRPRTQGTNHHSVDSLLRSVVDAQGGGGPAIMQYEH